MGAVRDAGSQRRASAIGLQLWAAVTPSVPCTLRALGLVRPHAQGLLLVTPHSSGSDLPFPRWSCRSPVHLHDPHAVHRQVRARPTPVTAVSDADHYDGSEPAQLVEQLAYPVGWRELPRPEQPANGIDRRDMHLEYVATGPCGPCRT